MNRKLREAIYDKYEGRCAYCGNSIEYKNMQVDHVWPIRLGGDNSFDNLNPACRRCNHYKRASTVDSFRQLLLTLHNRIQNDYVTKVGIDYGIISIKPFDGLFYFEKCNDVLNVNQR